MKLTYNNYLKIDDLLDLQQLRSNPPEHDEMLFITIHQTYELWFKQILHEFGKLQKELEDGQTWTSLKTMDRVLTILKTMVAQVDILETMTPLEFNSFRGFLDEASGFQSVQFREIEILCGLRSSHMLKAHESQPDYVQRLKRRMSQPTLWESFGVYLQKRGYQITPPERLDKEGLIHESTPAMRSTLIEVMNEDPESALLCEAFVDFDEGLQEWRYRHVKMVERTIGTKKGTGGSDGVKYLRRTLHQRIFPDLWEIRSEI